MWKSHIKEENYNKILKIDKNLSGRDNIAVSAHIFSQLTDFEQKYGQKRTETLYYWISSKISFKSKIDF